MSSVITGQDSLDKRLINAIHTNDIKLTEKLFKQGAKVTISEERGAYVSALCLASEFCKTAAMAQLLIENGAHINESSTDYVTHWTSIFSAITERNLAVIELLINKGVGINDSCAYELTGEPIFTPLTKATLNNNVGSIRLLVSLGADMELKGGQGLTPTEMAIAVNSNEALEALIELGIDYRAINSMGQSLLEFASTFGNQFAISTIENRLIMDELTGKNKQTPKQGMSR